MNDSFPTRPFEASYTSHVAYARALEEYCNTLEQLIDANNLPSRTPTAWGCSRKDLDTIAAKVLDNTFNTEKKQ